MDVVRSVHHRLAIAIVLAACATGGWTLPAAAARAEDPFADELNPFGKGPAPTAPAGPSSPPPRSERPGLPEPAARPPRPRVKLPVPFPETDRDDDEAARGRRIVPGAGRDRRSSEPRSGGFDRQGSGAGFGSDEPLREPSEAEQTLAEAEKLAEQGKLAEARDRLRDVVRMDPQFAMGHLALGVVLRRLGDFRGSVEACSAGIKVAPQEPELYLRRGIAWFHLGMHGIALQDFEDAAGMAYDDPRPELWRGLALVELDRPLEAINAYAAAIRRDPSCMLAHLNRGLAYLSTGEPGKAELDFDQAIRQQPQDARVWAGRGVAQARQGRYREAIESYERALGIDPRDQAARRNLEAARRMAGR